MTNDINPTNLFLRQSHRRCGDNCSTNSSGRLLLFRTFLLLCVSYLLLRLSPFSSSSSSSSSSLQHQGFFCSLFLAPHSVIFLREAEALTIPITTRTRTITNKNNFARSTSRQRFQKTGAIRLVSSSSSSSSSSSLLTLEATSSSDLKKGQKATSSSGKTNNKKESVVKRLKRAASRAAAAKKAVTNAQQQQPSSIRAPRMHDNQPANETSTVNREHLPSLRDLTRVIDQQLQRQGQQQTSSPAQGRNLMLAQPPPDSMGAIFSHNQRSQQQRQEQSSPLKRMYGSSSSSDNNASSNVAIKNVAILLAKPLQDDQITVEGAARIKLLVKSMMAKSQDEEIEDNSSVSTATTYDLICFVGGTCGDNRVADADAAYLYFRHLCASQNVPLKMPMHLERRSINSALQPIVQHVQQKCLPSWLEEMRQQTTTASAGLITNEKPPSNKKKKKQKLQIHFSLISSEYQLCQLNNIHMRSPNQSVLRAFAPDKFRSGVEARWSYLYTTTATGYVDSPLRAFCAKSYRTAQELVPVLYNLRGVVDRQEFLQRDNYKVLVAARRKLVADAESMYARQPSLQAVHQILSTNKNVGNNKPLDVVLESALLSLGRCLDLIRPAGLLTGSVSSEDFKRALTTLQQAYYLLDRACDPDLPLDPESWGLLNGVGPIRTTAEFSRANILGQVGAVATDDDDGDDDASTDEEDFIL